MSRLYRWPKKGLRILYKIRHHKGHGIHSPFAYNLIRNVIEEKLPYYAYNDLSHYLESFEGKRLYLKKEHRLAFRLVNHLEAKKILEIGSGLGVNTLCLSSPSEQIKCFALETNQEQYQFASKLYQGAQRNIIQIQNLSEVSESTIFDCIYINLNSYNLFSEEDLCKLIDRCHEKSLIIVKGIRRTKKQNRLWKCLTNDKRRTMELDLYHLGILFFDTKLYRWRYQISF